MPSCDIDVKHVSLTIPSKAANSDSRIIWWYVKWLTDENCCAICLLVVLPCAVVCGCVGCKIGNVRGSSQYSVHIYYDAV